MDSNNVKDTNSDNIYFTKEIFDDYFALENSTIFQDMFKETIEQNLRKLKGKNVYDVGFGTGFCLKIFLKKGLKSYTGLDLSKDMVTYLKTFAQAQDPETPIHFVQGDSTEDIQHEYGDFDIVISTFAMYVNSQEKLKGYTKHLHQALKDGGELHLMVLHLDFKHDRERDNVLENQFNHYLLPKLADGERYQEFSKVGILLTPPFFENEIKMEEFVVGKESLLNALKKAGFSEITQIDMITKPGKEYLLKLSDAFAVAYYRCTKANKNFV